MKQGVPVKTSESARNKIARLRVEFVRSLPQRIEELKELFAQLLADTSDSAVAVELHRCIHNLQGTGRSFGFVPLGAAARDAEQRIVELLEGEGFSSGWQESVGQQIECIASASSELLANDEGAPALPLPTPDLSETTSNPAVLKAGRKVYLCEKDESISEQMASQLACFGYQCKCFTSLPTMRQAVLEFQPDAVVMDIHFLQDDQEEGDGETPEVKQTSEKTVPTVFMASASDFQARLSAVRADGQAFLSKPVQIMEMVTMLDELTGQQQPGVYRILVVDDEPETASYHCALVEEAGMLAYPLSDAARILEVLDEFHPDLVLLDIYLKECNGRDLAKIIRQLPDYLSLPIIFLSSETDDKKQSSAMQVGAEGFLTKPVVPKKLVEAVAIRAERMRVLRSLMARDSLTGLFNHSATTRLIDSSLHAAQRSGDTMCFVMIDIDLFKAVNDTHGHPAGDQVILALARLMQQRLRASDIIGRYGGEEFALILQDTSVEHTAELVDTLREAFSQIQFYSSLSDFKCSFSAGIACFPHHDQLEFLREAADKALYLAKHQGRNQIVIDSTKTRGKGDYE